MYLQDHGNETTYFETIYGAKKKKIRREIRKYLEMNENEKYNIPKLMVHGKNGANGNFQL